MLNAGPEVTGGTKPWRRLPANVAAGSSASRRGLSLVRVTPSRAATALRNISTRCASIVTPLATFPRERVSSLMAPSCGLTYTSVTSSSAMARMTVGPRYRLSISSSRSRRSAAGLRLLSRSFASRTINPSVAIVAPYCERRPASLHAGTLRFRRACRRQRPHAAVLRDCGERSGSGTCEVTRGCDCCRTEGLSGRRSTGFKLAGVVCRMVDGGGASGVNRSSNDRWVFHKAIAPAPRWWRRGFVLRLAVLWILPCGVAVVGACDAFDDAADIRIVVRKLLRLVPVPRSQFAFLIPSRSPHVDTAGIDNADMKSPADMLGGNGFHHLADRPARPEAALFRRSSGQELADELIADIGTAVFGA